MREAQHLHQKTRRPESDSPPATFLGHCLMDSDAESLRLARRNRRRSMLLSTGIQVALLTAALVVPLFASQALPLIINDPPIPFPKGIRVVDPLPAGGERTHTASESRTVRIPLDAFQPPRVPQGTPQIDDRNDGPIRSGALPDPSVPFGDPDGTELSGIIPDGRVSVAPPPVDEPRSRGPVNVSKGAQAAKLIYKVEPRYPALARQIRLEGNVELRAIIAADGTVQNLEVVSGHPLFIETTLQAVRQWRYQPTLLNDKPVEVQTYITVIFRLSRN
jgi:TonB family protein